MPTSACDSRRGTSRLNYSGRRENAILMNFPNPVPLNFHGILRLVVPRGWRDRARLIGSIIVANSPFDKRPFTCLSSKNASFFRGTMRSPLSLLRKGQKATPQKMQQFFHPRKRPAGFMLFISLLKEKKTNNKLGKIVPTTSLRFTDKCFYFFPNFIGAFFRRSDPFCLFSVEWGFGL